jgi:hypothetical protein
MNEFVNICCSSHSPSGFSSLRSWLLIRHQAKDQQVESAWLTISKKTPP